MRFFEKNPYRHPGRLADVIGAITALGIYRHYKLSFPEWSERIANNRDHAEKWGSLMSEHPEFFRISAEDQRASLVWRRQNPKSYDTRNGCEITRQQFKDMGDEERIYISRRPLEPSELTALINVAISLHERAIDEHKANKWWVHIAVAFLAFFGALIGAALR